MARDAVALRTFEHARDSYPAGSVIRDLSDGHFADWEAVRLVRAATPEESAEAAKPRRQRRSRAPR